MKEGKISRAAIWGAAVVVLAVAKVGVASGLAGDAAWGLGHIIHTAGLVCILVWLREWKKSCDAADKREDTHE